MRVLVRRGSVLGSVAVLTAASFALAGPSAAAAVGGSAVGGSAVGGSAAALSARGVSVHLVPVGQAAHLSPAAHLMGPLASSTPVRLDVVLKPRDPAALSAEVQAVSDPASPEYHHFLARGQFAALFGPSASTISAVRSSIVALGLQPGQVSSDGLVIPVRTTAARVQSALHVHLSAYSVEGRSAFAATTPPSLPSSIATAVQAITGLDTVDLPRPHISVSAQHAPGVFPSPAAAHLVPAQHLGPRTAGPSCAAVTTQAANHGAWTACQIASAYGFTSAYANGDLGAGETIALYEEEPYSPSDVQSFEQAYGISTTVTQVNVDGGPGTGAGSGEAALDIENVISLAPDATVLVYQGPPGSGTDIWNKIISDMRAAVVSTSWGLCESSEGSANAQAEAPLFQEAALNGQSILAAAGDSGSEDCFTANNPDSSLQVDDPGSQPDVTSVGGTSLTSVSPPAEVTWNNCQAQGASCATGTLSAGAGGGGISSNWTMPSWQAGAGVLNPYSSSAPCGGGTTDCREVPDVSAEADPSDGYLVYHSAAWGGAGGTSGAAPVWAAVVALADQACGSPAGLLNPTLYGLAASHPSDFNDVTSGNNDFTNTHNGLYPATPGYDMATGLGTPTASLFLPGALCQGTSPPATTTTTSTTSPPATTTTTSTTSPPATTTTTSTAPATSTTTVPAGPPQGPGYWMLDRAGNVYSFGTAAQFCAQQSVCPSPGISSAAAIAPTPDGGGYWVASPAGAVAAAGNADATLTQSAPVKPGSQVVSMASTPDGGGYWLATDTGQVITAGDAPDEGSPQSQGLKLAGFIVNMAPTADGKGYWMLDDTGGVMTFGDARYFGSPGQLNPSLPPGGKNSILPLNKPAVAMASTADGRGYWFVAADGGIFSFGDAAFYGSTGQLNPSQPPGGNNSIVGALAGPVDGMVVTSDGAGYWMVGSDGGVFAFGDASFVGSLGGSNSPPSPVIGFAPV